MIALALTAILATAPACPDVAQQQRRNLAEMMRRTPAQERWEREMYRDGAQVGRGR